MALISHHQSEAFKLPFKLPPVFGPVSCFLGIKKVEGCASAIEHAILHGGDFSGLDRKCCDAITILADDCMPIIFPGRPYMALVAIAACIRKFDDVSYGPVASAPVNY
ncbi:unnamed protein product [Microthlaspi erraticum]|uniref:Prolamin-like domain-containing protein n=1 Tax=Microthlaspi erraticum TaxID=1685480 RepID=A0A6D2ISB6_9BRAS|nr:unnamed protein product [Microthlaspi erraticum]